MRGQSVVLRAAVEVLLYVRDAAQRAEAEKADWIAASAGAQGDVIFVYPPGGSAFPAVFLWAGQGKSRAAFYANLSIAFYIIIRIQSHVAAHIRSFRFHMPVLQVLNWVCAANAFICLFEPSVMHNKRIICAASAFYFFILSGL